MSSLGDIKASAAKDNVVNTFYMNTLYVKTLEADTLDVGDLLVEGKLEVEGATTLDSTLEVEGATTLDSTLEVEGTATFDDTATFGEEILVSGTAPRISLENTTTGTSAAMIDLKGASTVSDPLRLKQDETGKGFLTNLKDGKDIDIKTTGAGVVNLSYITIGGTSVLTNFVRAGLTPILQFGGASTGITYTLQTGQYTNIGDCCHFVVNIGLSNKGSATGDATIDVLPFVPVSGKVITTMVYATNLTSATASQYYGNISSLNPSQIALLQVVNSTGVQSTLTDANFANNTTLIVQGFYFTT